MITEQMLEQEGFVAEFPDHVSHLEKCLLYSDNMFEEKYFMVYRSFDDMIRPFKEFKGVDLLEWAESYWVISDVDASFGITGLTHDEYDELTKFINYAVVGSSIAFSNMVFVCIEQTINRADV